MIFDPSPDLAKYCDLMEEVKLRVNVIDFFISRKVHALYPPPTLESACLQLRKILELVAFGSLVANKDAYTAVYGNFSKKWDAGDLLKELGRSQSRFFYPFPIIEVNFYPSPRSCRPPKTRRGLSCGIGFHESVRKMRR